LDLFPALGGQEEDEVRVGWIAQLFSSFFVAITVSQRYRFERAAGAIRGFAQLRKPARRSID
jgi:hypothetical protein